ncbi:aminotransferase class I/II-fold pyridoxal phosphate-dependent enzyme [Geodermatophilus sp. YIM 151500]|uniref:MalY/PatB family protein n=1 Tax=Geodermatophilus sp. YIM 151500 TaxID=2984531 RepID=UPI0021E3FDAA|nr:aminotransferase class I/II-fold pyridoxal phosphate-dependent enzyme [Geodermatophilus sp. YIM 151500]MCV2490037.1 aminotransferase class I/II-fold pyridoxal phosphate-dependent enzyme [Geodermatophilus sp. YIM 151500]
MDELPVAPLEVLRERRSAKWRTFPPDVLPLPVAEHDFPLAEPIAEALHAAVGRSDTGYAMAAPVLGQAVAGFAGRRWGWEIEPARVAAVGDVGVGVVELLRVLAGPGRTVVFSPPVYSPFFNWVPEAGATTVEVPLRRTDDGWRLDLPALERAFADRPAAYVLCSPHNPVGRVHAAEELGALVELARRYGVTVVADEIHAPLVLPGATFTPILTLPGAADVAVSLVSASKAWNLAGLKCAAVVAGSARTAELLGRLPADLRWRVGHFGVLASIAAFTDGEPWLDRLLLTLDRRRSQLAGLLAARLPEVRWHPPEATYLAWLDCRRFGEGDGPRDAVLERARIALEPGPRYGAPGSGHVRLNFGTSAEVVDTAVAGMARALRSGR